MALHEIGLRVSHYLLADLDKFLVNRYSANQMSNNIFTALSTPTRRSIMDQVRAARENEVWSSPMFFVCNAKLIARQNRALVLFPQRVDTDADPASTSTDQDPDEESPQDPPQAPSQPPDSSQQRHPPQSPTNPRQPPDRRSATHNQRDHAKKEQAGHQFEMKEISEVHQDNGTNQYFVNGIVGGCQCSLQ